jgi:hypothetical protein
MDRAMTDRETALRKLTVGDIFHAQSRNGASLVCLVTALDDDTIYARRIHTQDDERFDRNTGIEVGKQYTSIDCVMAFPPDIQNILLAMDRKYQGLMALVRQGIDLTLDQTRMTADERRAYGFLDEHIAANPI